MSKNAYLPPDDDDEQPETATLRVWVLRAALVAVGLLVGVGLPYVWYLDKQVRTEFAHLQWQVPTRVYARPLMLREGVRLNPEALELELTAAGYRRDGVGKLPGTYVRDGSRFHVYRVRAVKLPEPALLGRIGQSLPAQESTAHQVDLFPFLNS